MVSSEALNLKALFVLRIIAISSELLALLIAILLLHMDLPVVPLALAIGLHAAINIAVWFRLKYVQYASAPEFAFHLSLDTLVLALLLYYAGGYTNPFVSLFLLPLVVTASVLPQKYTWAMAALTISCYTLLMFYYVPLPQPHMQHMDHAAMGHSSEFDLHVLGMWFSFLLSAGLVVFFVVRMANSLRERDHALALAREKALHDEHLVALGTLATGAAHELGTPLSTMAVLANELKHDHPEDAEVVEKAEILRGQIDRCKSIISDISASAGHARGEGGGSIALDDYVRDVVEQWQLIRPDAKMHLDIQGEQPAPQILSDKTLTQAIINILNNAADASIDKVDIDVLWDNETLTIKVCDQGDGFDEAIRSAVGSPFISTKNDGLGLGLYLAKAVLNRYNGSLDISNQPECGAQVILTLPLTALKI